MAWPTSAFPTSLDTITDKLSADDIIADDINGTYDCIEHLQVKVGVDSSAVATSLDYLLKHASSSNPGHKHTLAQGATDVTASAAELNLLDDTVAGTAVASKALALGANKNVDVLAVADLKLGAGAGTSVTATAAELNVLDGGTQGDLFYFTTVWAKLAKGTASQFLRMNSGATAPEWVSVLPSPMLLGGVSGGNTVSAAWITTATYKVFIPSGATYIKFACWLLTGGGSVVAHARLKIGALHSGEVASSMGSGGEWEVLGSGMDVSTVANSLVDLEIEMYDQGDASGVTCLLLSVYLTSS